MTIAGEIYIDGKWIEGQGGAMERRSPADDSLVWTGRAASIEQTSNAVQIASRVGTEWAGAPLENRIQVVRRFGEELASRREELASLISREIGKPRWEAESEVAASIAKVELSISSLGERVGVVELQLDGYRAVERRRPVGVMLVLGPFNFPSHLPGGQIIPSLLAGNTVVFKPSEQAPAVGQLLAQTWQQAGLPSGVLNLVQGGPEVATAAIEHRNIGGVLFTGSHRVGSLIHRQLGGRPDVMLALEMGGNNPLVVLDVDRHPDAVDLVIQSAYLSAGQRCTCARRLIVVDTPGNRSFLDRLTESIRQVRCGLPDADPAPLVGPLVSPAAAAATIKTQTDLQGLGGRPIVPARTDEHCAALVSPGLIDVTGCEVPDEECFGPLLQMHWVKGLEDAIELASATRFGLAAGLVGGTRDDFELFRQGCGAGVVNWNRQLTGASGRLAFGGLRASGNHRAAGYHAIDFCSDPVASLESET